MSSSSSKSTKKILDDANPCGCGLPSRIWTSRTEDNPEKKFRACSNRWAPNQKKCHFWQWVDEDKGTEPIELKLSILENDFNVYKVKTNKECVSLRNELDDCLRRNVARLDIWLTQMSAPVDWEIPEDLMTVNVPVMEVPKPGRPKNKDRIPSQGKGPIIRKCSRCQKSGHRRDNCPAPVPRYSGESSRQRTKSNTIQATTTETDSVTASQIESQNASQTYYMFPTYGLQ
ncbi:hypothetical protein LXL04_030862 [Taraxacum kok-saghyz]